MRSLFMRVLGLCAILACTQAFSDVQPHPLFNDGMVLQQGMRVPVWGSADDGEKVTVEFQGQNASTVAQDGKWMVHLENLPASKPNDGGSEMTIKGRNTIHIQDVLVGEVWIASGQSNMEWHVAWSADPENEAANANYPAIRFFTVPKKVAAEPQTLVEAEWVTANPETAGAFSAVGYYFARNLHQTLNVPIGILHTSWGGTPAESWTSREALQGDPELKRISDRWDQQVSEYSSQLNQYGESLHKWYEQTQEAVKNNQSVPGMPEVPRDPRFQAWRASGLYNAMIAPLVPYAVQGAIWYQGESNAGRAHQYRNLFKTMIQDWRNQWKQDRFHFLFVQLANFQPGNAKEGSWAELREAQQMALELEDTGMAVTTDIGDSKDIHPKNKQEVGRRLALAALAKAYGKNLEYSGPIYDSMRVEDGKIRVFFKHANSGLMFQGAPTLNGFTIAGEDGEFKKAIAYIEGNNVVVSSGQVSNPHAVRYNWLNDPVEGNLYNNAGLPAAPFRTDRFPGVTEGVE